MMKRNKKANLFVLILSSIILFIGILLFAAAEWYLATFGDVGFDAVLFTLMEGVEEAESSLIIAFLIKTIIPALIGTAVVIPILFASLKRKVVLRVGEKRKFTLYPLRKGIAALCSVVLSVALMISAADRVELLSYIRYLSEQSTIFEEIYVDPSEATITFPEQKQNLIWIYLESMEATFFSKAQGGYMEESLIPELYTLAAENTNFSPNSGVGGYYALSGATWTIGGLVSSTAGIPLKVPPGIQKNRYGRDTDDFLPGVTSMTSILHENGYYQALMVGSDSAFGGRKAYFTQHGLDRIYDLYTAREDGIAPEGYKVWWGIEDWRLFEYAKQALTEIAQQEQPFAFSMLTVDTHNTDGYLCELCGNDFDEQYENVLACSSKQVSAFIDWIQQQDFYENTTIVIMGDHPTLDKAYVARRVPEGAVRTGYNCFINARAQTDNTRNRVFCTLDMFPSVLAAMGCDIEGDRLGLGTNLFSSTPTLCEEMGKDEFNEELAKRSEYYFKQFYF